MRPIDRGPHPLDVGGIPVVFPEYVYARPYLIEQLGEYCSYCEMHLDSSLAVEHIQPKSALPDLALTWNNLLLGCVNCNSTKGHGPIQLSEYYWPDQDNTFTKFVYQQGGVILVNQILLMPEEQRIAQQTLRLTGLDKTPDNNPTASDRRWNNRREAWDNAERARDRLQSNDTPELRAQIIETARANGYWSIWMTVFAQDQDMRQRLVDAFPGTCHHCIVPDFPAAQYCLHVQHT